MAEERVERRLSAIPAADIAGYRALMGADEAHTVRDLNSALPSSKRISEKPASVQSPLSGIASVQSSNASPRRSAKLLHTRRIWVKLTGIRYSLAMGIK
jgi:hypothetical protein